MDNIDNHFGKVTMSADTAAFCIVAAIRGGRKIMAVKIIKDWCDCNLRSAMNMLEAFAAMGGSDTAAATKIAACLPLGKVAEVI